MAKIMINFALNNINFASFPSSYFVKTFSKTGPLQECLLDYKGDSENNSQKDQ